MAVSPHTDVTPGSFSASVNLPAAAFTFLDALYQVGIFRRKWGCLAYSSLILEAEKNHTGQTLETPHFKLKPWRHNRYPD